MWGSILLHAWQHAVLAATSLAAATILGAALGAAAARGGASRAIIMAGAAIGRTIPSIALLTLALPFLGVGAPPAILALSALALPPIVVNVDLALRGVSTSALDAAEGLGMTPLQRFWRIRVPLALPVALSGVRTASVEVIGSATLATFIGAGGLGDDIVRALQTDDVSLLLISSGLVALMAFAVERLFTHAVHATEAPL